MCFGGGDTKKQTTQRTTPYRPAKAGLNQAIGDVTNIAADPTNFMTQYGPQSTANLAAAQQFAQSPTAAGQYLQPTIQGYTQAGLGAALPGMVETATGPIDPNENPYYAAMRDRLATDIAQNVNAAASGAGRYGSGMHTGVLTDRLTSGLGTMDYKAYADAQARQDAAQRDLARYGISLAGEAGALDESQLAKIALGQKVGAQYDQRLNDPRLAQQRAPEWSLGLLSPIAARFGTTKGTQTVSQEVPLGNQLLNAGMMGLGAMSGGGFGSLLGGFGGAATYGLGNELLGRMGGQPMRGGMPLYGPF